MPTSPGAGASAWLRRTIFRTPGPLRWVAIAAVTAFVGLAVVAGIVVNAGFGSAPLVNVEPLDGAGANSVAGALGTPPTPGTRPKPVPEKLVPLVLAAGKVCPAVPAYRIAAQLMAASGFDPNVLGESGAQGLAQFRPELWDRYAPTASASPIDAEDAVPALGQAMCELVTDFEELGGNAYEVALAAFLWGPERVREAGGVPDAPSLHSFANMVSDYTDYYARDPRLGGGTGSGTPSGRTGRDPAPRPSPAAGATGSPSPSTAGPTASPSGSPDSPLIATSPSAPNWQTRTIKATAALRPGESWTTDRLRFTVTGDGNLVLHDQNRQVWTANSGGRGGRLLVFQADGNLVLYNRYNTPVWGTRTSGNDGAVLVLRGDGNMVITRDGGILWQTGTR